jgi:hypothetical protein
MSAAYTISEAGDAITCHTCGMTSHNPNDVLHRYCGRCHVFLEDPEIPGPTFTEKEES